MNIEQIGKFIREKRTEQGLSQTQVAEKANLSYRKILDTEKAKRNFSIKVAIDILNALGYEISFIPVQSIMIDGVKYRFKGLLPAKVGDKFEKEFKTQQ